MTNLSDFYGVMAGVCFTLLGLWWVAVQERPDLRRRDSGGGRMAYVVSLQFVLPGMAALLSQVAPEVSALWRFSFVATGLAGTAGIVLIKPRLRSAGVRGSSTLLTFVGVPLYLIVALVAALPELGSALGLALTGAQLEGTLFCLLVLLGAQTAWLVAMSPAESEASV